MMREVGEGPAVDMTHPTSDYNRRKEATRSRARLSFISYFLVELIIWKLARLFLSFYQCE